MTDWLILTDLDGSLLDLETHSCDSAHAALETIRRRGIPLAFVSSKTRPELEQIRAELGVDGPDISENGASIRLPDGTVDQLGTGIDALRQSLADISAELGIRTHPFGEHGVEGVMRATGLTREQAELALDRDGDEPFQAPGADPKALQAAARARNLSVLRGDRYYHLVGHGGKGAACERLLDWYRAHGSSPTTLAIGDAPNDLPMLQIADVAVCVPRPEGPDTEILDAIPDIRLAPAPGAAGWSRAVLEILGESTDANGHPSRGDDPGSGSSRTS